MVFFRRRCKKFIPTTNDPSRCFCGRLEAEHDASVAQNLSNPVKPPNRALKFVSSKLLQTNPSHDQSEHDFERWNVAKHTTLYPTNAYGTIEFENMLHPAKAHYLRLAYDTNPSQIAHLFTKQWGLQLPNLVRRINQIGRINVDPCLNLDRQYSWWHSKFRITTSSSSSVETRSSQSSENGWCMDLYFRY